MIGSNRFCHFGGSSGRRSRRPADPPWLSREARGADRGAWDELFEGYCDFYERPSTPAHRDRVWSWIDSGAIRCLLAAPADDPGGRPVGLAHVRPCPSPLRGSTNGYLDDLFVALPARGTGAVEALFGGIRELAAAEGWSNVRWITAADNARAQAAYERLASRTGWITYQLDL